MYTTKAYLQKSNKKGYSPIYIRYTYKRNPKGIALNLSVEKIKFDSKSGFVKSQYPEAAGINLAIIEAQKIIHEVASTLLNPEYEKVKDLYLKRLSELKEQKNVELKHSVLKRRGKLKEDLFNHFEAEDIPLQIKELQRQINELLSKQKDLHQKGYKNESFEESEFKSYLSEYPDRFLTQTPNAVSHIKSWSKTLLEFSKETNTPLTYEVFDYKFYNKYANYLMFDREVKFSNNNFGNHVKKLKSFLKWLEDEKDITTVNKGYKKFKVLKETKKIIFLSEEELELLWQYKKICKPTYQKYIDVCMFGNLTGLRYSDIVRSDWEIEKGFLKGLTKKTSGNYNIPLLLDPRILEILNQYKFRLDIVSEVKYNKYIKTICKELFEYHNINQTPIPIKRVRLKKEDITFKYKYELISSHSNRRGFCTRMYQNHDYTERDILLMIGSKSNEILRKYVRNSTEDLMNKVIQKKKASEVAKTTTDA